MPVTRKQVAARADVSEATVSYVVNNGPRPVATQTRARVLQAIEELGYHPSDVARSLRMQRTSTIGIVVPDTANPFYGEIARIIENVGNENGYTVILCNSHLEPSREGRYINMLRTRRVEGVLIIPTSHEAVTQLQQDGIPAVVLEYDIDGAYCLVADDFQGGLTVTEYLIRLGHTRIGCITRLADNTSSQRRIEGYRTALHRAGLPLDPNLIVEAEPDIAPGEQAAFKLINYPDPPTAIFAHNDLMALGVLSAIRKCGLRTPDDISVVGFDDITEAAYVNPPLTTVAYPKQQIGERAANLLIALMQDKPVPPPYTTTLGVTLLERDSTAPPRTLAKRVAYQKG